MQATEQITEKKIEVKVAFPLSTRGAFHHHYTREATVGTVRVAAMAHFGAREEPGTRYYLTDDRHEDRELPDSETIGSLAPHDEPQHLTLVKDLVQG
jgi:hypothetical protein